MNAKKSFKMPHVYIILMIIMLLVVVISYIIPSGNFEQITDPVTGVTTVNPDQFIFVEKTAGTGVMDFFRSIFEGMVGGSEIIFSLLICSGVLGCLEDTGTFGAAVHKMLQRADGKELWIVSIFYTIFAVFGVLGYGENAYPLYAITVAIIMALGFDRLAGAATIMVSSSAGFTCGMLNLFTTGVSQKIVGLPLFSGIGYRAISFIVFYFIGIIMVLWYCKAIQKDPQKSYVKEEYLHQCEAGTSAETAGEFVEMNWKHGAALTGFILMVGVQGFGCLKYSWGMAEVAALYIIFVVPLSILFRTNMNTVCQSFVKGAGNVLGAALAVGLARAVMLLMQDGNILDTIVYYMAGVLQDKGAALTLLLILLFVTVLNFFVVSGSGKAVMMMPVLSPLGKLLGINQQVMVLTYQFGDGFTNYLWPAGALVGCSLCSIEYGPWFRFAWKVFGLQILSAYILIVIANAIGYGPF